MEVGEEKKWVRVLGSWGAVERWMKPEVESRGEGGRV